MVICGLCGVPPRQDDPLATIQFEGALGGTVTAAACRDCHCKVTGLPPPAVRLYPHGKDWPFKVCGVCRQALREGDRGEIMRVAPEDCEADGVEPGCYGNCCQECVDRYRPRIAVRLGLPVEQVAGNMLL
jgi:hypothetical protein